MSVDSLPAKAGKLPRKGGRVSPRAGYGGTRNTTRRATRRDRPSEIPPLSITPAPRALVARQRADALFHGIVRVASGAPSKPEALGHREYFIMYKHQDTPGLLQGCRS